MTKNKIVAVLTALAVTFLWSTSFILIKKGLEDIPPLTFAGLRYLLASAALAPLVCGKKRRMEFRSLSRRRWLSLALLGVLFYALTQGIQFIGLSLISPVTVSLMLNFTPLAVLLMGLPLPGERPGLLQAAGILVFLAGVLLYFLPLESLAGEKIGMAVMALGVLANAGSSILGRRVNRDRDISPVMVTFVSMTVGALILTALGLLIEGLPRMGARSVLYLLWLAVINTALAFTLWNYSLRTLTAVESSIINGTMLIQIAVLSVIFLDVALSGRKAAALAVAALGAVLVQMKARKRSP